MRILYVSQYFPPEIGAPSARVSELARHWTRVGHEVTVLTGFPNHPSGKIPPEWRSRFRRVFYREKFDDIDVVRTWLLPFPNRKSHERILNYSSFCISAGIRGMFLRRPDVVIATSPQLLVGLAGRWLAWVKRVPMVLEIRDIWPDAILASGVSRPGSLLARFLRGLSRWLYRRADHIVVVTPAFERELVGKWGVPAKKITVVLNGVETDLFAPSEDPANDKASLGVDRGFVVSYVGTLGLAHGLDAVLDAAAVLRSQSPDVTFLIVGDGAERDHLASRVAREGLDNVRLVGQLPREKVPSAIGASDVCLVVLKEAENFKMVIPTKMLEFMSCGRPTIVGVDGQAREIIEEADAGVYVPPGDSSALGEAILSLREDPERRQILGTNGRSYIVGHLSRTQTSKDYLRLLEQVLLSAGATNSAAR